MNAAHYSDQYFLLEKLPKLRKRHVTGAYVRSGTSLAVWFLTLIIFLFRAIGFHTFIGITASVAYLVLMNPPALFCLRHIRSKRLYDVFSLFINQLEIIGYTAIIYFYGGVEASYFTLLYSGLIVYVGNFTPKKIPFIVASLCVLTYFAMSMLTHFGYLPQISMIQRESYPLSLRLWTLLIVSGLLYIFAYSSATVASLLSRHENQVHEKNKELVQTNEMLAQEIEERRLAEEALSQNERRFREIVGLLPTIICETDLDMRITYMNQIGLELLGLSNTDLESRIRLNEMIRLQDREKALQFFQTLSADTLSTDPFSIDTLSADTLSSDALSKKTLSAGKNVESSEIRFQRRDGSEIVALLCASPIINKGHRVGFRMSITDMTERRRLEQQLQHAEKMEAIGTLAGGIAHNFNNLLMGIQGYTSIIMMDTPSGDPRYMRLQSIEKQISNGAKLTKQLLGYAQEGKYEIKQLTLNQLIAEAFDTLVTTKKEIRLHLELDEDLYPVMADQGQMELMLLNIYVNATEAMPEGGDLFIKTQNVHTKDIQNTPFKVTGSEQYVQLIIRDTGIGMDKKTVERIFEPFFTTKGLAGGTGLGLASVYGIITGHGGTIDVKSEIGQGTTIRIYMPAVEESIAFTPRLEKEISKGHGLLLLIDDEEVMLDIGQEYLSMLGYDVVVARSGNEALDIYQEQKDQIDLVLLDMIMPGMTGSEAYDRLKQINPDIKVLLLSGYSLHGRAAEILNRGCNGFIQKPFSLNELSRRLNEILGKE
jgi:signal transduction histidine kinase/ActR/RegA family two-component response regulator